MAGHATGGGATDTIKFRWIVLEEGRTAAVLAMNDTLAEKDDVSFVGGQTSISVKYFLGGTALGPIKVAVTKGPAVLATEKGDMVGSPAVTVRPTDTPIGWFKVYSITKGIGQIEFTVFHWADEKWVKME